MRLLVVPLVIAVVVAGLWLTGGVITNDFTLAMALTGVWMAVAGLACLVLAVRSRALRWPVLGAYVLTAVVAGAYLGRSQFFDDEVMERVAIAAPAEAAMPAETERGERRNVLLRAGAFEPVRHEARGDAKLIELARGGRVLTLTGFEVDNGPDLRVYLVTGPARNEGEVEDFVDLGALKGNKGDQQYRLPKGIDAGRDATVVIWCRAFSVLFARAPLRE